MSVLLDRTTRVLVQGITGAMGRFQAEEIRRSGANLVAGVSPGRGGVRVADAPVFDTVAEAVAETGAEMSVMFVAGARTKDAAFEAFAGGIKTVIAIAEFVPVHDVILMKRRAKDAGARLIGPNCAGLISPGEAKVGFFCDDVCRPGDIGVMAKSGTLSYAILAEMKRRGLGASTVIGVGGDEIKGTTFADGLALFEADPRTRAMLIIGEVGGEDEERAADHIRTEGRKPVVAFITGRTVPPGRAIGHAGALIRGERGTHRSKIAALRSAGARVADSIEDIPDLLKP
ncbi:MAG: succinate--CoA ligase subunit alpha [Alphaproteobacteria bacterium]